MEGSSSIEGNDHSRGRPNNADVVSEKDLHCQKKCVLATRIAACILIFILVFTSSVLSKLTLILMVTNVFPSNGGLKNPNQTLQYFKENKFTNVDITWIWSLLLAIISPYVFAVFKYIWSLLWNKTGKTEKDNGKKKETKLNYKVLLAVFCIETLHSIGLSLFLLVVLPSFEPISGCMLSFSVSIVPAILKTAFVKEEIGSIRIGISRVIDFLTLIFQLCSQGLWIYYVYIAIGSTNSQSVTLMVLVPLSLIFMSVSWWENFVNYPKPDSDTPSFLRKRPMILEQLKENMDTHREKVGIIVNLWKIIIMIILMPCFVYVVFCKSHDNCIKVFFFQHVPAELRYISNANVTNTRNFGKNCISYLPFIVSIVNILSNLICFKLAKAACKILAQRLCFALPVILSTPAVVGIILGIYSRSINITFGKCTLLFPVWSDQDGNVFRDIRDTYWVVIVAGVLGYVSSIIVTNHVWFPLRIKLLTTDRLFIQPLFNGAFPDLSLLFNIRRSDEWDSDPILQQHPMTGLNYTTIYICVTTCQESIKNMEHTFESLFTLAAKNPLFSCVTYYVHIFIDDAFKTINQKQYVSRFVQELFTLIEKRINEPKSKMKIYATPYGGQVNWPFFKGNLIVHLKDKTKIRSKKRWSQIMCIKYIMESEGVTLSYISAKKVYIMVLDEGTFFNPMAVHLLIDRMKKHPTPEAVCGRIHPCGAGPMVWYQKFEYAIYHWFHKATENMIGCVTYRPGCISLFRMSSSKIENILKKYTAAKTDGKDYVQYDQEGDQLFSNILLQEGCKVEYVAASDAHTFVPEGLSEFYNQRKEWYQSLIINYVGRLKNWKTFTEKDENTSIFYIPYTSFVMMYAILTPGIVFLMIIGSISMAFPSIPPYAIFSINALLVIQFVLVCSVAGNKKQLASAAAICIFYTILMMAVLVGLVVDAANSGLCSVTSLAMLVLSIVIFVTALLHPMESRCVLHGILYFIFLPSMSMLLTIYSLGNMHVMNFETEKAYEAASVPSQETQHLNRILSWLTTFCSGNGSSSCGNLNCILCPNSDNQRTVPSAAHVPQDATDENLHHHTRVTLDEITCQIPASNRHEMSERQKRDIKSLEEQKNNTTESTWAQDDIFTNSLVDEEMFWEGLASEELKPFTRKDKEKMEKKLQKLRNRVLFVALVVNVIFVASIYALTEVNDGTSQSLSIPLLCIVESWRIGKSQGHIKPIPFAFIAVFGLIVYLQFICMLFHRFSTFLHVAASTEIHWKTFIMNRFCKKE